MEAMACGCCAVASRVGGNPELIDDGRTGLLCETDSNSLAAALTRLIERPVLRETLGRNAATLIQRQFRLEAAGRRMGEIYRSFLPPATEDTDRFPGPHDSAALR
jgi:glycosyltransferase involved in cell wall biosynthesis